MSRGTPLSTQIIFAETQRDKALAVLGEKDDEIARLREELAKHRQPCAFKLGDRVEKIKGSQWKGVVVGTYSTELTPEGYAVESDTEKGSVQIYPAAALRLRTP